MYIKLLSSAMNIDTAIQAHPSYVEIIKSMSPLDAHIIKEFNESNLIPSAVIKLKLDETNFYSYAMPSIFSPQLLKCNDVFLVASSIENLCRLGLINHKENMYIPTYNYNSFTKHPFVVQNYYNYKKLSKGKKLILDIQKSVLEKTEFGKNFITTCVS